MKKFLILFLILVALGLGAYLVFKKEPPAPVPAPIVVVPEPSPKRVVIGKSVEGREIESFTYGTSLPDQSAGTKNLLFVGGVHGGYEWNSVLLAYEFMDYLKANPAVVPSNVSVTVIPSLNPDGVFKVIKKEGRFALADIPADAEEPLGKGRFNAHDVDLNRNFDCKWQPEATWRQQKVSAGTAAFSEPEAAALRDYVLSSKPSAVIFWHSQANAVYASECEAGILPDTREIMNAYSQASGYPPVDSFTAYPVSGDAEGWLASIGIPAITVELKTHETIEWTQNLAGTKAVMDYYKNN